MKNIFSFIYILSIFYCVSINAMASTISVPDAKGLIVIPCNNCASGHKIIYGVNIDSTYTDENESKSSAQGDVVYKGNPGDHLQNSVFASAIGNSSTEVNLEYYFKVIGPADSVMVDLKGDLHGTVDGPSSSTAVATVTVNNAGFTWFDPLEVIGNGGSTTQDKPYNETFSAMTGSVVDVSLNVEAFPYQFYQKGTYFISDASSDPQISIDPKTPDASKYSIVMSNGITTDNNGIVSGSVSLVPLPSALPLLAGALMLVGLIGFIIRRKKQKKSKKIYN